MRGKVVTWWCDLETDRKVRAVAIVVAVVIAVSGGFYGVFSEPDIIPASFSFEQSASIPKVVGAAAEVGGTGNVAPARNRGGYSVGLKEIQGRGDVDGLQELSIQEGGRRTDASDEHKDTPVERKLAVSAVAFLRGDIDLARAKVDEVLSLDRDNMAALNLRGQIEVFCGELAAAEVSYCEVERLAERSMSREFQAIAYCRLGAIYKSRGDMELAHRYWTDAVRLYKEIGTAHMVEIAQGWLDKLDGKED